MSLALRALELAAVAVIALSAAAPAAAQIRGAPERDTVGRRAWAVGVGVGGTELNLVTERPGTRAELFASVARSFYLTRNLDLRVQVVTGVAFPRALTLNAENRCDGCEIWTSRRMVGVANTLVREWRKGRALRPYVSAGTGIYLTRFRGSFEVPCDETVCRSYAAVFAPDYGKRRIGLGYVVGGGVAFRVFGADMFADVSRHDAPAPPGSAAFAPVTLGVRF